MARSAQRQQQIIDAFETLQAEFRALNPDYRPQGPPSPDPEKGARNTPGEVIEAWAWAVLDLDGTGPQSRRWGRALRERLLQRSETESGRDNRVREVPIESDLEKRLERYPDFDAQAAAVARWAAEGEKPKTGAPAAASSGPEAARLAREWRRTLPGLRGLKAWRFLEHLGFPVLPPEAPVRRLLFRFGEIEKPERRGEADGARLTGALQDLSRLTGIEIPTLRRLLRWAARGHASSQGGGWCASRPRCPNCPIESGCLWARFHGADPGRDGGNSADGGTLREQAERLKALAVEDLSDAEVLALVLRGGRGDPRAVDAASTLLHRIGELPELEKADADELEKTRGVGRSTARQIKAALELGRRIASQTLKEGMKLQGSGDVWAAYGQRFRHISQEHFIVLLLDTRNRFITHRIVSRGTLDSSSAHPREVFKEAIRASASAVILMHNHPSGDPSPSPEDRAVTRQLAEAGSILSIRVLDHIILGDEKYFSFRDEGEM